MKKMLRRGFTLTEILVCLAIIGIIVVFALSTLNPSKKATKYLYRNAYQALAKAYYNGLVDTPYGPFKSYEESDGNLPDVKNLCRALTSFINTTQIGNSDYDTGCDSITGTVDVETTDFSENISFTAANNMAFYITQKYGGTTDYPIPFYLVYIDINGSDRGPNNMEGRGSTLPDIYAFALLNSAKVVPLGRPEYDTDILSARLGYSAGVDDAKYERRSYPYYKAQGRAWGAYADSDEFDIATKYDPEDPFTMNAYIREALGGIGGSNIYPEDFPLFGVTTEGDDDAAYPHEPIAEGNDSDGIPYNCGVGNFLNCFIYLDEYRY